MPCRYPYKYPSKAGLCQIYHATIRPNIRQRRVVSVYTMPLSVQISFKAELCQIYQATIRPNIRQSQGCVSYTTSLSVQNNIRQRRGCVQIYHATIRPNIRQRPRHHPSKYLSKAGLCQIYHATIRPNIRQNRGCVSYTTPLSVQISVKAGLCQIFATAMCLEGDDHFVLKRGGGGGLALFGNK